MRLTDLTLQAGYSYLLARYVPGPRPTANLNPHLTESQPSARTALYPRHAHGLAPPKGAPEEGRGVEGDTAVGHWTLLSTGQRPG